jgi:MFS family permease
LPVRADGGYGAVWADRPVRRLLIASLGGRVAFSMLPLAFVLFATAETGSAATAGALVAAFSVASALAPVRGRVVDRHGPRALIAFAFACSAGIGALAAAGAAGAPAGVLVLIGAAAGAVVPPLGPFTRAVWGAVLREGGGRLPLVFALDSAGEEASLVVAPLVVALIVAEGSPSGALIVAAAGLLIGTAAAGRSGLAARLDAEAEPPDPAAAARPPLPGALWLVIASLIGPGAALGTINVAVPALSRAAGAPARAGLLLAALAIGTVAATLAAGRRAWTWAPPLRLCVFQVVLAAALAVAALAAGRPVAVAAALLVAGAAVGALFVTLYVLVDELTPPGAATRTFAWLVTANNGGLALGAAGAGALIAAKGGAAGLWLGFACALVGVGVAGIAVFAR